MPEKEAKRAFGIVPKGSLRENPCDACQRTCRRKRRTHAIPQTSRFLNTRIASFAHRRRFRVHSLCIVRVTSKSLGARGEGFNRRVSISVLRINVASLTRLGAPKLPACVAGIESVRYDFEGFLLSQRLISLWLRLLFPKGSLWDFLGKKVTSSVRIRWARQRHSLCPKESESLPTDRWT